jgi:hypothetical protein
LLTATILPWMASTLTSVMSREPGVATSKDQNGNELAVLSDHELPLLAVAHYLRLVDLFFLRFQDLASTGVTNVVKLNETTPVVH